MDIILPILHLLAARTAVTTLVKVKSHSGVPLNEAADVMADQGQTSTTVVFTPLANADTIHLYDGTGEPITALKTFLRTSYHQPVAVLQWLLLCMMFA